MHMEKEKFDVIIIGGGSGAKLAHALSEKGFRIAIIDREILGGTCLNHGCIPSKMLIHSAEIAKQIERAARFNLNAKLIDCHFNDLVTRVTEEVTRRAKKMTSSFVKNPRLNFFQNSCKFVDSKTLKVGKSFITAKKIIIASGAHPYIPSIPGLDRTPYITSREALRLKKLPKHLVIIGGGYIAAELGFFFSVLGAKVTVLARSKLLSKEDEDITKEFTRIFKTYASLHLKTKVTSVNYQKKTFYIDYREQSKKGAIEADQLLVATGIRGFTENLGLDNTKIKVDRKGFIKVNRYLQTDEKHIWAIGDVIGYPCFRHTANFEANYLLKILSSSKRPSPIRYSAIPHGMFSYPQVSGVGMSELRLKEMKIPYIVGKYNYNKTGRGLAVQPEGGFAKLLFEKTTQRLLGAQIIGPEACSLTHILSAFIQKKGKLKDILGMIYIHPSLPEVVKKAAQEAEKIFST